VGPKQTNPSTSHAHSLCRLNNDRAVNTAEICIKGGQLRPQIIHSSAATRRRQSKIASVKKGTVDLTLRRNSRTGHLKRASPDLPCQESIAGPISRGVIAVCTTKGDVCLQHQKEWYCRWRSEGSVVRHQHHRHPQAAHCVPAIQPGTSVLHT